MSIRLIWRTRQTLFTFNGLWHTQAGSYLRPVIFGVNFSHATQDGHIPCVSHGKNRMSQGVETGVH